MTTPSWTAWADAQPELPAAAAHLLDKAIGTLAPSAPALIDAAVLPASALSAAAEAELVDVLGGVRGVARDDETRARHAGGQAYGDIVRRRHGDAGAAPDAVLWPESPEAVSDVLRVCAAHHIAVVPWGGGTSVVGGLDSLRGACEAIVALDLSRLDRLLHVDETSLLATFQPGIRTPDAEAALAPYGLTLGHVPQSFERASLGGYVVTRSAGQSSSGVGRVDDLVVGLRVATPIGELVLPAVPASAAGPDLRRLILGSEGTLGVVTEVTLRVRRIPATQVYEGWMLPSWEDGLEVMRRLAQDGPLPDVARLSDPQETQVSMTMARSGRLTRNALRGYLRVRGVSGGCLLITGYQGNAQEVSHRRDGVRDLLAGSSAVSLGKKAGAAWEHSRFAGPRLRDTLLDSGALAETLETAATWTLLPDVYDAVRGALTAALGRVVVGCHVSHLYATGASLYFTVIAAAEPGRELEQWGIAKRAANDAIVAAGGTITHHHAVGTAHREHVGRDLGGDVGITALRAVKYALDPNGILNPGKLLPDPWL